MGEEEKAKGTNSFDSQLKRKSGTGLLSEVRNDFGAGSQVYVSLLSTVQDVRAGKLVSSEAAQTAEAILKACEPRVPPEKIQRYCELILDINSAKEKGGLSTEAEAFIPSEN